MKTVLLEDSPTQAARNSGEDGGGQLGLVLRSLQPTEQQELHTKGKLLVEDVSGTCRPPACSRETWCWVSTGSESRPWRT